MKNLMGVKKWWSDTIWSFSVTAFDIISMVWRRGLHPLLGKTHAGCLVVKCYGRPFFLTELHSKTVLLHRGYFLVRNIGVLLLWVFWMKLCRLQWILKGGGYRFALSSYKLYKKKHGNDWTIFCNMVFSEWLLVHDKFDSIISIRGSHWSIQHTR